MTKEKKSDRVRVPSDTEAGGSGGGRGTTASVRDQAGGKGGNRGRGAQKGQGGVLEPRPVKGIVIALDTEVEEVRRDSPSATGTVEADTYALIPRESAESCTCDGACKEGRHPEYCANWLARTHRMTMERCSKSGDRTWHRDGQCADCHPLFPPGAYFKW